MSRLEKLEEIQTRFEEEIKSFNDFIKSRIEKGKPIRIGDECLSIEIGGRIYSADAICIIDDEACLHLVGEDGEYLNHEIKYLEIGYIVEIAAILGY